MLALVGYLLLSPSTAEEAKPKAPKAAKGQKSAAQKPATPEKEKPAAAEALAGRPGRGRNPGDQADDTGRVYPCRQDLVRPGPRRPCQGLPQEGHRCQTGTQQLADLGEECGSAVFVELAGRQGLLPEAKTLADAVLAAVRFRLQDAERIADLIGQLQDPSPKKRVQAAMGLQQAGVAAVGPLIGVLADRARSAEHANVRAVLAEMGRAARSADGGRRRCRPQAFRSRRSGCWQRWAIRRLRFAS